MGVEVPMVIGKFRGKLGGAVCHRENVMQPLPKLLCDFLFATLHNSVASIFLWQDEDEYICVIM